MNLRDSSETESDWVAHFCSGHNTISSFVRRLILIKKKLDRRESKGRGEAPEVDEAGVPLL